MNLALPSSFYTDAEAFLQGECVLVRFTMTIDIAQPNDTAAGSVGLPPTSSASSPQHFAFVRSALLRDDASTKLRHIQLFLSPTREEQSKVTMP